MVIFEKKSWVSMFFTTKGSVIERIWKRVLMATLFALAVTLVFDFELHHGMIGERKLTMTPLPFSLIAFALSIFLGFRNNSSYDRFWEGRKLWGRMINITRTLTRQVFSMVEPAHGGLDGDDADEAREAYRKEQVYRLIGYLHAFRHHLRDERDFEDVRPFLPEAEYDRLLTDPNPPIGVLHTMGERFRDVWREGWIESIHVQTLEQSLTTMTDIQGGCERIKKTPIPFAYTALMHRLVGTYCFALPFGLYDTIGDLTPVVVAFISYVFFGLDAIGEETEEPFGYDENDLPLTAFCTMLEIEARARLGEEGLPEPAKPVRQVLT